MSELISGKEALIALANGEVVEVKSPHDEWYCDWGTIKPEHTKMFLSAFLVDRHGFMFRLKPQTVTLNGIELPKPCFIGWGDQNRNRVEIDFNSEAEAEEFFNKFRGFM